MTTIATKYPFVGTFESRQGGRNENQDSVNYMDTPLGLLLVVCDGMGGGPGGKTASAMAVNFIISTLANVAVHTSRHDALKFAIEKANDIIYAKSMQIDELRGMGTTVAAMLINEESAVIAHVGDSRIYQLRKGSIVFRSKDHSVVSNLVSQGRLTEEEARNHPEANLITHALGIQPNTEIEFDETLFLQGDRFVICTDGVWSAMPQQDLLGSLTRVMGIERLTKAVADEIDELGHNLGGYHDNFTLVILDVPFNSSAKAIRKAKCRAVSVSTPLPHSSRSYSKFLNKISGWAFVGMILLLPISARFQLKHDSLNNDTEPLVGETTTTLTKSIKTWPKKENIDEDSAHDEFFYPMKSFPNRIDGVSPIIEHHRTDLSLKIKSLIISLDSIKNIRGGTKKDVVKRKYKYIKNIVEPQVNWLDGLIYEEKKREKLAIIKKMIKSSQAYPLVDNRSSKGESDKYIDEIKDIVKALEE